MSNTQYDDKLHMHTLYIHFDLTTKTKTSNMEFLSALVVAALNISKKGGCLYSIIDIIYKSQLW